MKRQILCALGAIIFLIEGSAQVNLVPQDYESIQSAIDQAAEGDTVLVDTGIYYENINFRGKDIVLTSYFRKRQNFNTIFGTIIDGSQPSADTGRTVLFISGESDQCVMEGFTIQGGSPSNSIQGSSEGAGMYIASASPVIRFNLFRDNYASTGGGGVSTNQSEAVFTNNIFYNNTGSHSAAFVGNNSAVTFKNNLVTQNISGSSYHGVVGIFSVEEMVSIVENNTIVGNASALGGAGLTVWQNNYTAARNNIIYGNASDPGDQISLQWDASADFYYNLLPEEESGSDNLVNTHPRFAANTYYLSDSSQAIDAGDPDSVYNDQADTTETAFFPSKGTSRNDMGYFGGPLADSFGIETGGKLYVENSIRLTLTMEEAFDTTATVYNLGLQPDQIDSITSDLYTYQLDIAEPSIGSLSNTTLNISGTMPVEEDVDDTIRIYSQNTEAPVLLVLRLRFDEEVTNLNDTEHWNKNDVLVYPNPSDHLLHVEFPQAQTGWMHLYDTGGKVRKSLKIEHESYKLVDLHELPGGSYFLRIQTDVMNKVKPIQLR